MYKNEGDGNNLYSDSDSYDDVCDSVDGETQFTEIDVNHWNVS